MTRLSVFLIFAITAFVCDAKMRAANVRLGTNPGVVIRLRRNAIDPFFKNVAQLSHAYAHKVPIPDVSATVSGVDVQTKNIRITNFPPPQIKYRLVAPNKIVGYVNLPKVGLEGPFNATRHVMVTTQTDSGIIVFNATNIAVNFTAEIGEFDNGVPNVANFDCSSSLGPANLHVRGAKEKFAIEVMTLAAKGFRPLYNSQVCQVITKLIRNQINRFLSKIPNVIDVNPKASVKFHAKPLVAEDYIEMRLFGKVITDTVSPFVPAQFEEAYNQDTMVVLFVSDALLNDLLYQAYINKALEFTIDKNSQPILYDMVRLNCSTDHLACLGNVAPNLITKYGMDAPIEAVFKASKAPEVQFEKGKASFTAGLDANLYAIPTNGTEKLHETKASVNVTGKFQIKIKDDTAFAKIAIDKVLVHIDESQNQKWESKIGETIRKVVEEYINGDFLFKGLPLRLPFGVGFQEPLVNFLTHTLQIQTGFEYQAVASGERKH